MYTFDWLDRVIDRLAKAGVDLCSSRPPRLPTPAWVERKIPPMSLTVDAPGAEASARQSSRLLPQLSELPATRWPPSSAKSRFATESTRASSSGTSTTSMAATGRPTATANAAAAGSARSSRSDTARLRRAQRRLVDRVLGPHVHGLRPGGCSLRTRRGEHPGHEGRLAAFPVAELRRVLRARGPHPARCHARRPGDDEPHGGILPARLPSLRGRIGRGVVGQLPDAGHAGVPCRVLACPHARAAERDSPFS